jgi:predicted MPP superfamily phosphohydrolase
MRKEALMRRRAFLLAMTAGAGGGYSRWLEPRWLELNETRCALPGFAPARGVKIAHLSDLHACPNVPNELIEEAVALAVGSAPDLICVTGDFVSWRGGYDRAWYVRVLSRLAKAAPTYATLGNHDGGRWSHRHGDGWATSLVVADLVREAGLTVLLNENRRVMVGERALNLVGLGDLWAMEFAPERAFDGVERGPTVVLSHNPDTKDRLGEYGWELMLSGHTHGGQVVIPGLGAPWTPVVDKRYLEGLKPWNGRQIHVSRGVGNARGIRFNCRPEVNLLTLV